MAIAYSWESYFNAFFKVENVLTKNRDKLAINFDHFKLMKLTVLEDEFLREYIKIMKPLTEAYTSFKMKKKCQLDVSYPFSKFLGENYRVQRRQKHHPLQTVYFRWYREKVSMVFRKKAISVFHL